MPSPEKQDALEKLQSAMAALPQPVPSGKDVPDTTPDFAGEYADLDLTDPAQERTARQYIEKLADQMYQLGIGAPDYYGLMDLHTSLQRTFFIHIPKCGGTSIRNMLIRNNKCAPVPLPGMGTIDQAIHYMATSFRPVSPQGRLLRSYLSEDIAQDHRKRFLRVYAGYLLTQNPVRLFILGHQKAREMKRHYRAEKDIFFTTVRAPEEILKSMVSFRVSHTLKDSKRPDSINLLKHLQMDIGQFTQAVEYHPQSLAEKIVQNKPPSLAAFLSFEQRPTHASVIKGIKDNKVFIAHMSEQSLMLGSLFGEQSDQPRENTSHDRNGLDADFTAAMQADWTTPFVDRESALVYQYLESSGIVGYWKNGGTQAGYLELIKNL